MPYFELIEEARAKKLQPSVATTWAAVLAFAQDKGLFQHIAKRTAARFTSSTTKGLSGVVEKSPAHID